MSASSIYVTGDIPSPRNYAAVTSIDENVILFGGEPIVSGETWDSQLYILNTASNQWSKIKANGNLPRARSGHTISAHNGSIYIWGGQSQGHYLNDLYEFRLREYPTKTNWVPILYTNQSPSPRTGHMSVVYNNRLYIFGGVDANRLYNDVWYFDLTSQVWNQVKAVGYIPPPRESCAAALVNDTIYIFGGRGPNGVILGDLYAFRLKNQRWYTFQNMGTPPSARYGTSLTLCQKKLYVFGGESVNGKTEDGSHIHILDCSKIKYPPETPENEFDKSPFNDTLTQETVRRSSIATPSKPPSTRLPDPPIQDHPGAVESPASRRQSNHNRESATKSPIARPPREGSSIGSLKRISSPRSEEKSKLLREILVRDTIISEMKKKEHWWRTEVSIVRHAYSEKASLKEDRHSMLFDFKNEGDDKNRLLLEQLVKAKTEIRKMKNGLIKQADTMAQNISRPEGVRAAALEEASYYKSKYVALKSRDIVSLNKVEDERIEYLEKRLREAHAQKEDVNALLLDAQRYSQENQTGRLLAEERASIAQRQAEVAQEAHQAALEKISKLYGNILKTETKCREDTIKIANLSNSLVHQLSLKENHVDLSEVHIKMVRLEAMNIKYRNEMAVLLKELEEAQDRQEAFEAMLTEKEQEYTDSLIELERIHIELDLVKKNTAYKQNNNHKEVATELG
ncbi:hypothetical protein BY458DRAFT_513843 [Sporodiniella umbellata]|nr:hypothetical protein BY458DRAFT_513843 [Sporodiniella umbellata]